MDLLKGHHVSSILLKQITSWSNTQNMSFNPDKSSSIYLSLALSFHKSTVWQPVSLPPPFTFLTIFLKKFFHSNCCVSLSVRIFLGKPHFEVGFQSSPLNRNPPSYKVLPWHTWTLMHLQGVHWQLDGVLLSPLGCLPCLTSCSAWRHGNEGLPVHWDLPQWSCIDVPIIFPSQTGRWFSGFYLFLFCFCTLCPFPNLLPNLSQCHPQTRKYFYTQ